MLVIDGSRGEGGGQMLRSALALSMLTETPFRMVRVRAGRAKPGLQRQHLASVRAAASVCGAKVRGDALHSRELTFEPGPVQGGDYHFPIGTAGSTTLVLQTILPPLLLAAAPSRVTLEGGTHNPFAPPFPFLARTYVPLINRMGPTVTVSLNRPGFFPAGGGELLVTIEPARSLSGLELLNRGTIVRKSATALVAHLPHHIAQRELDVVAQRLQWSGEQLQVLDANTSRGPGNALILEVESESLCEVFSAFGQRGRPAEAVAHDAVEQCREYLDSDAPVGEHLCDQLMLPLAIAGHGTYRALRLSQHAETHIELIHQFLSCEVRTTLDDSNCLVVRVET